MHRSVANLQVFQVLTHLGAHAKKTEMESKENNGNTNKMMEEKRALSQGKTG
jgi:hypothetical protein